MNSHSFKGLDAHCLFKMKALGSLVFSILSLVSLVSAASSWAFEDATLTIQAKGAGVGGGKQEKYA